MWVTVLWKIIQYLLGESSHTRDLFSFSLLTGVQIVITQSLICPDKLQTSPFHLQSAFRNFSQQRFLFWCHQIVPTTTQNLYLVIPHDMWDRVQTLQHDINRSQLWPLPISWNSSPSLFQERTLLVQNQFMHCFSTCIMNGAKVSVLHACYTPGFFWAASSCEWCPETPEPLICHGSRHLWGTIS